LDPVIAVWMAVLPSAFVRRNFTDAPETAVVPLATAADIGTVLLVE
jgi:hypothetical protein